MTKSILILAAWMPSILLAQGVAPGGAPPAMGVPRWMSQRGQAGPISGKPLSAIETVQTMQVLADGTHLDNGGTNRFYRDDQGRMRSESEQYAIIFDPVARSIYSLVTLTIRGVNTYRETAVPEGAAWCSIMATNNGTGSAFSYVKQVGPETAPNIPTSDGAEPPVTVQLPPQIVNGVATGGTRVTVNIPAGAAGNDQAIQIVREQWYSADLGVVVKSTISDPRYGTTAYNLTQVQQGAPDPALFKVPAGYVQAPSGRGRGSK